MEAVQRAPHGAVTPVGPFGPVVAAARAAHLLSGEPDGVVRADRPTGASGVVVKGLIMPCQALRGRPQEAHPRW